MNNLAAFEAQSLIGFKLKGLGPKSKEKLIEAGIDTVGQLLALIPREYQDFSSVTSISQAPMDLPLHVRGTLLSISLAKTRYKRVSVLQALVDDGSGTLRLIWYNQAYLRSRLVNGNTYSFFGKIKPERQGRAMVNPKLSLAAASALEAGGVVPVYRQIQGLRSEQLTRWINQLIDALPDHETLPAAILEHFGFPTRKAAFRRVHTPDADQVEEIRKRTCPALGRLIFEEFFHFQCQLSQLVANTQGRSHYRLQALNEALTPFFAALPFEPTGDQYRIINQLLEELQAGNRLYHLIQGDVGSGKTLIAMALAHVFAKEGFQSALLCPTQVLASQHHQKAQQRLAHLHTTSDLFTAHIGSGGEELERLATGTCKLAIGTHKLFQKDVAFHKLGLVMIDEQHRFGVGQRQALLRKGQDAHYLAFSATPIPRSLALTLHGDFEVMQLREKPAQRKPVHTVLKRVENRDDVIAFVRRRLTQHESVFWVFPLIEGDEQQLEKSAIAMHATFSQEVFPNRSVGLVHGRMKKDAIGEEMARFKRGETHILVATTVIEVGVDIPHASVMVVENANHFGLSQLHQLRGRVGRGDQQSFCFLMLQEPYSKPALERMRLLERSEDGFEIAEFDLKLRGAGHLLGKKQAGMADFRFGDPWRDRDLMDSAREMAREQSKVIGGKGTQS